LAACASAADTAAEKYQQQQQHSEEYRQDDQREQVFYYPLTIATGETFATLTVVIRRWTSSLGAAGTVLTSPVRTIPVI